MKLEPAIEPPIHPAPRAVPTRAVRMAWDEVAIDGAAVEVPSVALPTAELEDRLRPLYRKLGFKPGWVETVTGIGERRMWSPHERFLDGAVRAARRAMVEAGVRAEHVQAVVSCSVYKDRLEPSLACEVQRALGVPATAINFDVANACLGFLTGMATVANMVALGQIETGLVVSAEDAGPVVRATVEALTRSDADIHAFKAHLATLTLGSGAAAVVLSRRRDGPRRFLGGVSLSAAHHFDLCVGDAHGMQTDSVRLLREGVALAGRTWAELCDLFGWDGQDVRLFATHQVGKAHHEAVIRQLGVPLDRAPVIYPWLGNVGSCGVPMTALLAAGQGQVRTGETLALMGIGSGLNCMMMGIRW